METLKTVLLIFLSIGYLSCNTDKSLQEYIVEKQQSDEFISIDIPSSILKLKDDNSSDETLAALKTIKKFNIVGLQITDSNKELYNTEKQNVKNILENKKFKEILRAKTGKSEITVKYLGDENNIDEVIFFGADNEKGLALVRVLGDNMNPAQMVQLMNKINLDKNNKSLEGLKSIFENL